jgi:hypothetical protein
MLLNGIQEVGGSTPPGSTKEINWLLCASARGNPAFPLISRTLTGRQLQFLSFQTRSTLTRADHPVSLLAKPVCSLERAVSVGRAGGTGRLDLGGGRPSALSQAAPHAFADLDAHGISVTCSHGRCHFLGRRAGWWLFCERQQPTCRSIADGAIGRAPCPPVSGNCHAKPPWRRLLSLGARFRRQPRAVKPRRGAPQKRAAPGIHGMIDSLGAHFAAACARPSQFSPPKKPQL